jgi:hypothetical protein
MDLPEVDRNVSLKQFNQVTINIGLIENREINEVAKICNR